MMRTLAAVAALIGMVSSVTAQEEPKTMAALTCFFQSGEHFTVIGAGGRTIIQWDDKSYYEVIADFKDPWLFVQQDAKGNKFRMAFNARTKEAYGETTFSNGEKRGGPLFCAWK